MFKPSLKRSKINQGSLRTQATSRGSQLTSSNDKATLLSKVENPGVYIPALLSKSSGVQNHKKEDKVICPFTSWDLQYPFEVKEKLNLPTQKVKSRLVGQKFGIFWLVTQNQLHLWRYGSDNPNALDLHRKFQFEQNIRAVAIGHLNKHQCQFFSFPNNCETFAIGFEYIVDLYSINLLTLQLKPIQIRLKIQSNQCLQMLQITKQKQIIFTGAQGFLTRVSFDGSDCFGYPKVNKSIGRHCSSRALLFSTDSLLKTSTKTYTQKILRSNSGKIYVLIRKQSEGSLLQRVGSKIKYFLQGKIRKNQEQLFIQKQICIYDVNEPNKGIKFVMKITNQEMDKKFRNSFSAQEIKNLLNIADQASQQRKNTIAAIFLDESNQCLRVATSTGMFLSVKQNPDAVDKSNQFNFLDGFQFMPKQLYFKNRIKNSTTTLMKVSENPTTYGTGDEGLSQIQSLVDKSSKLIFSMGDKSLNLMSNGLCFIYNQSQIQIIKLDKQPGVIVERISPSNNEEQETKIKSWLIFSKSQILFIKKSELYEHIVTALDSAKQLTMQAISNGQKVEYSEQANTVIKQFHKVLGHNQICKQLFNLLMRVSGSRTKNNIKPESYILTNTQIRESTKQEQRLRIKEAARLRYQSFLGENKNDGFKKWLMAKNKQVKPLKINIIDDFQLAIWRYFLVQQAERNQQKLNMKSQQYTKNLDQSLWVSLPLYPKLLISLFRQQFQEIKELNITKIRMWPITISKIKIKFNSFLHFLQQKRIRSSTVLLNFMPQRPEMLTNPQRKLVQEKTRDLISPNSLLDLNNSHEYSVNIKNILNEKNINISSAAEEIEIELLKIIPKIVSALELYEVLAANSQRKYENLPTLQSFFKSHDAKKQAKAAFLDLFSTVDLTSDDNIIRLNRNLPQLGLQSDIYLAKWVKFVSRGLYTKQFDANLPIKSQIKITDLKQLSKQLQISQTLKIKDFFNEIPSLYMQLLLDQMEWRKVQLNYSNQMLKRQKRLIDEAENGANMIGISIFQWDRFNCYSEWRGWLSSQMIQIKNEVAAYLQNLAGSLQYSGAEDYLFREKSFDETIKLVMDYGDGPEYIKQLITYLKQKMWLAEKVYRLSMMTTGNAKVIKTNLLQEAIRPEVMSSFDLINKHLSKTKQSMFQKSQSSQKSASLKNNDRLIL